MLPRTAPKPPALLLLLLLLLLVAAPAAGKVSARRRCLLPLPSPTPLSRDARAPPAEALPWSLCLAGAVLRAPRRSLGGDAPGSRSNSRD